MAGQSRVARDIIWGEAPKWEGRQLQRRGGPPPAGCCAMQKRSGTWRAPASAAGPPAPPGSPCPPPRAPSPAGSPGDHGAMNAARPPPQKNCSKQVFHAVLQVPQLPVLFVLFVICFSCSVCFFSPPGTKLAIHRVRVYTKLQLFFF